MPSTYICCGLLPLLLKWSRLFVCHVLFWYPRYLTRLAFVWCRQTKYRKKVGLTIYQKNRLQKARFVCDAHYDSDSQSRLDGIIRWYHTTTNKRFSVRRHDISHLILKCLRIKGNLHSSVCCSQLQKSAEPTNCSLSCGIPSAAFQPDNSVTDNGVFSTWQSCFLAYAFNLHAVMIEWHSRISFFSCLCGSLHFSVWKLEVTSLFVSHRHNANSDLGVGTTWSFHLQFLCSFCIP